MKSQRRHELQENALSDWIDDAIQRIAPHAKLILAAIGGVIVLVAAVVLWQTQAAANRNAAWSAFYAALRTDDARAELLKVADAHQSEPVGLWARLYVADASLADGMQDVMQKRDTARAKLREAAQNYRILVEEVGNGDELFASRALFGEAKANEALGEKENLEQAGRLYQQIVERFPNCAVATQAAERVAALKTTSTREFYDWFATAKPPAPSSAAPGVPGLGPAFDPKNLPAVPDTSVSPDFEPFTDGDAAPPVVGPALDGTTAPSAPQPDSEFTPDAPAGSSESADGEAAPADGPAEGEASPTEATSPDSPEVPTSNPAPN